MEIRKYFIVLLSSLICIPFFACCSKSSQAKGSSENIPKTDSMKLEITIGTNIFTATLVDNATAAALKKMLPMTLNMIELNGNEKYVDLPDGLPANTSNPANIKAGDLMLHGSNTLVLFYKSFSTSYTYTPMGHIDDVSGLTAALGRGNVEVFFSLAQ